MIKGCFCFVFLFVLFGFFFGLFFFYISFSFFFFLLCFGEGGGRGGGGGGGENLPSFLWKNKYNFISICDGKRPRRNYHGTPRIEKSLSWAIPVTAMRLSPRLPLTSGEPFQYRHERKIERKPAKSGRACVCIQEKSSCFSSRTC